MFSTNLPNPVRQDPIKVEYQAMDEGLETPAISKLVPSSHINDHLTHSASGIATSLHLIAGLVPGTPML